MQKTQEAVPFRYLTKIQRDIARSWVTTHKTSAARNGCTLENIEEWSWANSGNDLVPHARIGVASGPQQEPDA